MPIYEYLCKACGHAFEHLVLPWELEGEGPKCPKCGGDEAERLVSSSVFFRAGSKEEEGREEEEEFSDEDEDKPFGRKELKETWRSRKSWEE
ncbi:MAG: FmdB family zinc ribbon protein [bacterium]